MPLYKRDKKYPERDRESPHSLGGHGLLPEGDEGHSQGLIPDPALLFRDLLQQPVIHAGVVRDGVLLPEDISPQVT